MSDQKLLFDVSEPPPIGDPEDCRVSKRRTVRPHNGTPTSREAAQAIDPVAKTIAQRILRFVEERGWKGATRDEIVVALAVPIPTVCARCNELLRANRLQEVTGRDRLTTAGRRAAVLVAVRHERDG